MQIEDIIKLQLKKHLEIRNRAEVLRVKYNKQEVGSNHIPTYRYTIIGFSVAACMTFIFYLAQWIDFSYSPLNGRECPTLSEYRSASPFFVKIDKAIAEEDYERALGMIDNALAPSVKNRDDIAVFDASEDEALLYERELEESNHYQLRWIRIYALIQLSRIDEAIADLDAFSKLEGIHQEEAKKLLVILKSR